MTTDIVKAEQPKIKKSKLRIGNTTVYVKSVFTGEITLVKAIKNIIKLKLKSDEKLM